VLQHIARLFGIAKPRDPAVVRVRQHCGDPKRNGTKSIELMEYLESSLIANQKPGSWLSHHVDATRIAVCGGDLRQTCEHYMLNKAIYGLMVMIRSIGMDAGAPDIQVKRSHRRKA
jgi:hypothetical protein